MIVVSDAGPIISFTGIGHESILRQLFGIVLIPNAVYEEIIYAGENRLGAVFFKENHWLQRVDIQQHVDMNALPATLGIGEREAILLAEARNVPLLLDDLAARKEAHKRGLIYFGSLRVLQDAKKQGIIERVKPILVSLVQSGMWLSDAVYESFLNAMDE